MGRGIAYVALAAGYDTTLFDVSAEALDKACHAIAAIATKERAPLARLDTAENLADAVREAGVIIEAIPEQIALKISTFAEVQAHAPAHAVLATNTSALSITEMAAVLDNPARLAGMHFFNPVHRMRLVEIVRAAETSDATIAAVEEGGAEDGEGHSPRARVARLHHQPHQRHDRQRSVSTCCTRASPLPRDIDKALKLGLNHPMGPFELVDLVGLDTPPQHPAAPAPDAGREVPALPVVRGIRQGGRLGKRWAVGFMSTAARKRAAPHFVRYCLTMRGGPLRAANLRGLLTMITPCSDLFES
jgi:3-hydroxybutyryl-CoA dehydrogenase